MGNSKSYGGPRRGAGAPRKDPHGSRRGSVYFSATKEEGRKLKEFLERMRKEQKGNDELIG